MPDMTAMTAEQVRAELRRLVEFYRSLERGYRATKMTVAANDASATADRLDDLAARLSGMAAVPVQPIRRFDFGSWNYEAEIREDPEGDYVLYEDHCRALATAATAPGPPHV